MTPNPKTTNSFLLSCFDRTLNVVIDGVEYEYEMATPHQAAKAEWLFREKPFFVALGWLKRFRVNERRVA